jgi:threonine dehydrogenase-like Zn-dependent dehydrogenase
MMKSVIREWTVEVEGREHRFRVGYANTFDEPVGGLMNVLLTEDGQHYRHSDIQYGRALVIDIGGFTTDWVAETYQRIAGGSLSWDAIILTGGGSGLLYKRLLSILNHERVILADDLERIYLANVRNGSKMWKLYETLGILWGK